MTEAPRPQTLLLLAAGFGIWAVGFAVVYGVQGLGCEIGWDHVAIGPVSLLRVLTATLALVTLGAATGLAVMLWRQRHDGRSGPSRFLHSTVAWLAAAAVPAVAFTFVGVATLSTCAL